MSGVQQAWRNTGQLTAALQPPKRAAAYSGSAPGTDGGYSNYYQAYSTALDVERYDQALFSGKLVDASWLRTMIAPQAVVEPPDPTDPKVMPAATNLHYGYYWRIGTLFGHRVVFTADDTGSFQAINLHLPEGSLDVSVVSNDDTNQVGQITQGVVRLVLTA
jgi:CubicO group peptidase (beta-lactamase class C family)